MAQILQLVEMDKITQMGQPSQKARPVQISQPVKVFDLGQIVQMKKSEILYFFFSISELDIVQYTIYFFGEKRFMQSISYIRQFARRSFDKTSCFFGVNRTPEIDTDKRRVHPFGKTQEKFRQNKALTKSFLVQKN